MVISKVEVGGFDGALKVRSSRFDASKVRLGATAGVYSSSSLLLSLAEMSSGIEFECHSRSSCHCAIAVGLRSELIRSLTTMFIRSAGYTKGSVMKLMSSAKFIIRRG